MHDLHQIPRFDSALSYMYVEHARIDQQDKAIAVHDQSGSVPVPVASVAVLMLGPGTRITHAAVAACADNNCLIAWVGEHGVRLYAAGAGGTRSSSLLLRQAELACDPAARPAVVKRMYRKRFGTPLDPHLTIQQIRGMERIRIREAYAQASRDTGVAWTGRSYNRGNWSSADPVNRALSSGNACLYGLVHAAMLSLGYSPALGFIHTGQQLSFVYDVADFYIAELIIPLAFSVAAEGDEQVERRTRLACRDMFKSEKLMARIPGDIRWVLDIQAGDAESEKADVDLEPALPAGLWEPGWGGGRGSTVDGGLNYGSDDS